MSSLTSARASLRLSLVSRIRKQQDRSSWSLAHAATFLSTSSQAEHVVRAPTYSCRRSQLALPSLASSFTPNRHFPRHFSSSIPSRNEHQTTFVDPNRPDLFYHLVAPPTPLSSSRPVFAVSLLEAPPPSSTSSTILGWLPAEAEGESEGAGLNDFKENPRFRALLHEAISTGLVQGVDDIQINGAMQTQRGWMHINDDRNIPALGRIGDPDDILASIRVEDGKMLPDTYEPMPSYRLCTADGVTKLSDGLAAKLRAVLDERAQEEMANRAGN